MCRIISSDVVIGNFLIESINNDVMKLDFSDILRFEKNLNEMFTIESRDFYSNIYINDIYDTISMFNCISITDNHIEISVSEPQKPKLIEKLIEFFRYGLPALITGIFQSTYANLLTV